MKALLDTNIILDHLMAREPFAGPAMQIWQACVRGQYNGYVAPITPINVFYISRKLRPVEQARNAVGQILALFEVCPLSREMLKAALALPLRDFEDAVQCACAQAAGADVIVTRDTKDYANSNMAVLSPTDFLARLAT